MSPRRSSASLGGMPSGPAFADAKGSEAACFSCNLINQFRVGQWREPTAGTMTMLSEEPTRPFEWRRFPSAGGLISHHSLPG